MKRVLIFATHPIQYQAPLFRLLAKEVDLVVVYGFNPNAENQANAGFGVKFNWDIPLLEGYHYDFAKLGKYKSSNTAKRFGLILKRPLDIIDKYEPDVLIVLGWFPYGMVQMINAGHKRKIPVWVRGDSNLQMNESKIKTSFKSIYFRWLFSKITGFLYVGQLNRDFYQKFGVQKNEMIFAPHSVDNERFAKEFSKEKIRKNEKITLGFAGKFIEKKNPLELINAVSILRNKNNIEIFWIGDGPMRSSIELLCLQKGIPFSLAGFLNQSELVSLGYSNLDLLILPSSFNETWGLVVNEVYCGGIPVITSDKVGCAPDLVSTVDSKLVYPSGNVEALALSISYAIENLSDIKQKILSVSENYTILRTCEGFMKAINKPAVG